ncbi:hypothetical protein KUTeg_003369 [Tegillarca granosa]|uniref:G-protein coupled receptors family 1 profile domain-containing protein n=1 Tax=Tegillarca granosa TaxID=220873 RepID=A0ABQ9FLY3_TEGGR|nr:hypothetical protein KUTeg_003369 [Tegillarca granosa]
MNETNFLETSGDNFSEIFNLTYLNKSETVNSTVSNVTGFLELSLSQESLVGLIVLYSLTTVLSITGNIFVVLVFSLGRKSRTDLRPFLINLAAADLVMATFCMPFTFADVILGEWIFSEAVCPLVLFLQIFAVAASVLTNMAIGIDRFLVVTFPLRSRVTFSRAKYVIGIIWISSFILASVQFFVGRAVEHPDGKLRCNENWKEQSSRRIYSILILLFTYIVPLLILSVTYSIVGILLWKRTAPGNQDYARDMHRLRSKIKIVKMLVIVVTVFGLCWLPIHVFTLVIDYNPHLLQYDTQYDAMFFMALFLSVHWLAMSNSFANPIIYGFTNESFRTDLATLFYMWFPCCGCLKNAIPRSYSSSNTHESVVLRRQSTMNTRKCRTTTQDVSLSKSIYNNENKKYSALRQISKESTTEEI